MEKHSEVAALSGATLVVDIALHWRELQRYLKIKAEPEAGLLSESHSPVALGFSLGEQHPVLAELRVGERQWRTGIVKALPRVEVVLTQE